MGISLRTFGTISATFATKIVAAVAGLAASVIISRVLGPDGRGVFASAITLAAVGIQLGNLGLHTSNTFFLARDPGVLRQIIGNSLLASLAAAIVVNLGLGIVVVTTGLAKQLGIGLIVLAMLTVPAGLAYLLLQNLLLGIMRVGRFNYIEIGLKVCALVLVAAAVWYRYSSPFDLVLASLLAQIVALVAVLVALGERRLSASMPLLRQQIPFAFRSYLTTLFGFLLIRSDLLMVQHFSGNGEAGQYSIALSMADMVYMLPAAAGMVLFPQLSSAIGGKARDAATLSLLLHIGWSVPLAAGVAALLARPAVLLLFGAQFAPAVSIFYILAGAAVPLSLATILSIRLAAEGFPWSAVWVWLIALVLKVALNLLWVPPYGGVGAAFASLVAYTATVPLQVIALRLTAARGSATPLAALRREPIADANGLGS